MAHGGRRDGAGRKSGGKNRKTREVADRAAAEGITPLEVMVRAMRHHYEKGDLDRAAAIARDCAPYMHPRLSSVELGAQVSVEGQLRIRKVVVDAAQRPGTNGSAARDAGGVLPE